MLNLRDTIAHQLTHCWAPQLLHSCCTWLEASCIVCDAVFCTCCAQLTALSSARHIPVNGWHCSNTEWCGLCLLSAEDSTLSHTSHHAEGVQNDSTQQVLWLFQGKALLFFEVAVFLKVAFCCCCATLFASCHLLTFSSCKISCNFQLSCCLTTCHFPLGMLLYLHINLLQLLVAFIYCNLQLFVYVLSCQPRMKHMEAASHLWTIVFYYWVLPPSMRQQDREW